METSSSPRSFVLLFQAPHQSGSNSLLHFFFCSCPSLPELKQTERWTSQEVDGMAWKQVAWQENIIVLIAFLQHWLQLLIPSDDDKKRKQSIATYLLPFSTGNRLATNKRKMPLFLLYLTVALKCQNQQIIALKSLPKKLPSGTVQTRENNKKVTHLCSSSPHQLIVFCLIRTRIKTDLWIISRL